MALRDAFLAARDGGSDRATLEAMSNLEAELGRYLEAGRDRWPGVAVEPEHFARYLALRLEIVGDSFGTVQAEDLYLACACLDGDESAIRTFRDAYLPTVKAALGRYGPALADELTQQLLIKLFVGGEDKEPTISKYVGRGKLGAWVRVVVTRDAHTHMRGKHARVAPTDDMAKLVDRIIVTRDAELDELKKIYRNKFIEAFEKAFAELDAKQRNVLRHEHLDGLNIDKIGALYGAHRATVARWRTAARKCLLEKTEQLFRAELDSSTSEYQSIMRLIRSQVAGRIRDVIATPDPSKK